MTSCIKNIDKYSSDDDLVEFYQTLYECWKEKGIHMYNDPEINNILSRLLLIQDRKYYGYPNGTYVKLLYFTINMDIDKMKKDSDYNNFLKSFFMNLEENAITGIIPVKNENIINRLKYLKQLLKLDKLDKLDTSTISNTHIIMILL
jgi:hypothetical protein